MFTESLTHGSGHAGEALERLTTFLDSEGAHGRIPKTLQKKILGDNNILYDNIYKSIFTQV